MRIFSFEKLIAWQKSGELALLIFKTTKQFPKDELFALTTINEVSNFDILIQWGTKAE